MKIFLSKTALYAIVCTTQKISVNQWPSMFKSMAMRTGIDKKDYYKSKHLELSAFMPPKGAQNTL